MFNVSFLLVELSFSPESLSNLESHVISSGNILNDFFSSFEFCFMREGKDYLNYSFLIKD